MPPGLLRQLIIADVCLHAHLYLMQAMRTDPGFLAYVDQLEQAVERVEGLMLLDGR